MLVVVELVVVVVMLVKFLWWSVWWVLAEVVNLVLMDACCGERGTAA